MQLNKTMGYKSVLGRFMGIIGNFKVLNPYGYGGAFNVFNATGFDGNFKLFSKSGFGSNFKLTRFTGFVDVLKVLNLAGYGGTFNVFSGTFNVFNGSDFNVNCKMRQATNVKYSAVALALLAMLYGGVNNVLAMPAPALSQKIQAIGAGFDSKLRPSGVVATGSVDSGAYSGSPVDFGGQANVGDLVDSGVVVDSGAQVNVDKLIDAGIKVDSGVQANVGGLVDSGVKVDSSGQVNVGGLVDSGVKVDSVSQANAGGLVDSCRYSTTKFGEATQSQIFDNQLLLAYREGDFPGVGSEEKWKESQPYFNNSLKCKGTPQEVKLLQQAIDIYPYEGLYWNQLGTHMKTQEEQLVYYKKAVELNPDYVLAYTNVAGAYRLLGKHEKAVEWYKKAIGVDSSDFHLYAGVAGEYDKLKKYHEALPYAIQATKLTTNNVDAAGAMGALGECYQNLKQYDKALDYYFKSLALNPNYLYVIEDVGLCYKEMGNSKLAEEYKAKAIKECTNQEEINDINSDFAKTKLGH